MRPATAIQECPLLDHRRRRIALAAKVSSPPIHSKVLRNVSGYCAAAANGRNVRIAVIDHTKMLHSADNVRFGEAALRHCDRRPMSPLGREREARPCRGCKAYYDQRGQFGLYVAAEGLVDQAWNNDAPGPEPSFNEDRSALNLLSQSRPSTYRW